MLSKFRNIVERCITALAVVLMLALAVMSFVQVILRNFFSIGLNAVDELMRNGVLWIAFVGAVLTTLRSKHISIDILPRLLKGRVKVVLDWILHLTVSAICLCFTWYSIRFIQLELRMRSMIAGFIPAWTIEIILPIGFFLLTIAYLLRILDKSSTETR